MIKSLYTFFVKDVSVDYWLQIPHYVHYRVMLPMTAQSRRRHVKKQDFSFKISSLTVRKGLLRMAFDSIYTRFILYSMGPLPYMQNFGLRMRRICRERFPRDHGLAIKSCRDRKFVVFF